ncbi:MAG: nitrate reductase molybdenum cofactor assembly chaperone [Methylococcales bacterium]|nr:nitrate reductase molybdenum cofactor assembly chaperone [Methylococcales bacterium]
MSDSRTLSLKALSVLLCYPSVDMIQALPEIEVALSDDSLATIKPLIERFQHTDLLALQENYVALFDRGRALSLHLFEHLHGESRDRGQAMVDLMDMYQSHGFDINTHELPDYIPLFLEFLAQQPHAKACDLLGNTSAILQALAERLEARDSAYYVLFDALLVLAEKKRTTQGQIEKAVAETDETILKMDEIWEEEAVTFMGNNNTCTANTATEQPIKFTPPTAGVRAKTS